MQRGSKAILEKNGTYVQPYQRSAHDGILFNNYSFPGNYNPNTNKISGSVLSTYFNNFSFGYFPYLNNKNNLNLISSFDFGLLPPVLSPAPIPTPKPTLIPIIKTVDEIKAEKENKYLNNEQLVDVDPTDDDQVHIKIHNKALNTPGRYAHIKAHERDMAIKKARPDLFINMPAKMLEINLHNSK